MAAHSGEVARAQEPEGAAREDVLSPRGGGSGSGWQTRASGNPDAGVWAVSTGLKTHSVFFFFFFIKNLTKKTTWLGFSEWEPDVFGEASQQRSGF